MVPEQFGVSSSLVVGEIKGLPKPVSEFTQDDATSVYVSLLSDFSEFAALQGFTWIEIELGFSLMGASELVPVIGDLKRSISRFKNVSCHLPLADINISALHPTVRRDSVEETKRCIDLCEEMGISRLVMHPGSFGAAPDRYRFLEAQARRIAETSVLEILDYCRTRGMELSIENLHCNEPLYNRPEEFDPFVERGTGLTLDTVHAFVSGVDPLDFIKRFGGGITEVHLTDGVTSDPVAHLPLGAGDVDCLSVLRELETIGFEGSIVIEVESKEALIESMEFLRQVGYLK